LNTSTTSFQDNNTSVLIPKKLRWFFISLFCITSLALFSALFLWSKLSTIEQILAKQSAESNSQSLEAKVNSKDAQELARETAAKLALLDAKVMEVSLQRAQLEELMVSLSHTRDENLVNEIESALKLAEQQSQLTGSAQPLISALKNAEQRVAKSSQPKIISIDRALIKDIDLIKSTPVFDTPSLIIKLDQLTQKVVDLPLLNEPQPKIVESNFNSVQDERINSAMDSNRKSTGEKSWSQSIRGAGSIVDSDHWWNIVSVHIWDQIKGLVRITRIDQPEASLLTPSQSYFLKENLKLRTLNAKLSLLAHQMSSFKADLDECDKELNKYFDMQSKQGQSVSALLKEIHTLSMQPETPVIQNTWAAISAASIGH
jgi:uroporphyrin-3 C-methyltransferase